MWRLTLFIVYQGVLAYAEEKKNIKSIGIDICYDNDYRSCSGKCSWKDWIAISTQY